jgi:hypothetical protein
MESGKTIEETSGVREWNGQQVAQLHDSYVRIMMMMVMMVITTMPIFPDFFQNVTY